jgi:hypothetical protein
MSTTIASDLSQSSTDDAVKKTRIKAAAWTAGLTAFFVLAAMDDSPTWPAAFVATCVVGMVSYVCHQILHYR